MNDITEPVSSWVSIPAEELHKMRAERDSMMAELQRYRELDKILTHAREVERLRAGLILSLQVLTELREANQ